MHAAARSPADAFAWKKSSFAFPKAPVNENAPFASVLTLVTRASAPAEPPR